MHTDQLAARVAGGKGMPLQRTRQIVLVVIVIAALAAAPAFINNFWLRSLTQALLLAALAQSMNVIYGLSGYPALGNIVFFGVGAYAGTIAATTYGLGAVVSLVAGASAAVVLAIIAARAIFGLRGSYFLMATVALNALMLEVVTVSRELTGGALGLAAPPWIVGNPGEVYRFFYYIMLAAVLGCGLLLFLLRRSSFGLGLMAIRGNEGAAEVLGVPTWRFKTLAWTISAGLSGALGVVYAHWIGYIDARTVFSLTTSIEIFLIVLIGGRYLVFGPIVGAILFETVSAVTSTTLSEFHLGVLGLLIVLFVMYLPNGLPDLPVQLRRITHRFGMAGSR